MTEKGEYILLVVQILYIFIWMSSYSDEISNEQFYIDRKGSNESSSQYKVIIIDNNNNFYTISLYFHSSDQI